MSLALPYEKRNEKPALRSWGLSGYILHTVKVLSVLLVQLQCFLEEVIHLRRSPRAPGHRPQHASGQKGSGNSLNNFNIRESFRFMRFAGRLGIRAKGTLYMTGTA